MLSKVAWGVEAESQLSYLYRELKANMRSCLKDNQQSKGKQKPKLSV